MRSILGSCFGVFLAFLIAALGVEGVGAQAVGLEAAIAVEILDESGVPPEVVPLDAVSVHMAGERRAVKGLERLRSGAWRILIWSDPELVPAERLAEAALLVQEESTALSELGSVELVVARGDLQTWMEAETNAEEIEAALEELATTRFGEADGAGEIRWRHQLLLSELAAPGTSGPKALVLVGGLGSESDENAEDLGASLAALGWTVVPVELGGSEDSAAASLAAVSGGRLVGSAAELRETLRDLSGRFWLRFERGTTLRPAALDVRSNRVGWRVAGPRWSPGLPEAVAEARAERYLRLGDPGKAELKTALEVVSEDDPPHPELRAEVMVDLDTLLSGGRRSSDLLRTSLFLVSADAEGELLHYRGRGADLSNSSRWLLEAALTASADLQEIVVVVENLASGEFGATHLDADRRSLGILGANTTVETVDLRPPRPVSAVGESRRAQEEKLIRLLPLMSRQATGNQTFKTLLLHDAIRRTEFYLDGQKVAEDGRAPFSASINLGPTVRPHILEIVAFDRLGRELSRDSVSVNGEVQAFAVEILSANPSGVSANSLDVRVSVTVPEEARLERVELYWNDTLRAVLETAPFTARVQTEARSSGVDFLRAVATLADGRSLEDVELFGVGSVEEVEVNLVEVFAVVTLRDGTPVRDLESSDFEITLRGRPVQIERFGLAAKLPLALGLVVDTSGSMDNIIQETKAAALQFLTELVSPRDQAFIVDFDTRPRLATGMTQDIRELFRALATLEPEGFTAIYDAIVFSSIQFERGQDRRALVLLTDGDDYKSRFEHTRAIKQARAGAIPVYIISLAGLDWLRPTVRRDDLELIAKQTGGRVFYVESRDQLAPAYAKIGAELRSQYVLAFSSGSALSDKDLERIEVKVKRRGLEVRAVVAGHSVQ